MVGRDSNFAKRDCQYERSKFLQVQGFSIIVRDFGVNVGDLVGGIGLKKGIDD